MSALDTNKAMGIDGISPKVLKEYLNQIFPLSIYVLVIVFYVPSERCT